MAGATGIQDQRLLRKIDLRLIPFLWVLFLFNFLDRANLGSVRSSLIDDIGLTELQYTLCVGIFFVGYVVFEIPSNLMLKRATPSKWLARIMVSWGIICVSMMFITSFAGLMICRFLLGIMEAGFFPGVIFYLTFWYRKEEQALRQSVFFTGATVAGALSGLLGFALLSMDGLGGLAGWQYVFLIEGIPSILLGITCWFYLPDDPSTAKFLTEDERAKVVARLDPIPPNSHVFNKKEFFATLVDGRIWLFAAVYVAVANPSYGMVYFMPALIERYGYNRLISNLLTVPVYAVATISSVAFAYSSDKRQERPIHIFVGTAISTLGYVLLAVLPPHVSYLACYVTSLGCFPAIIITLTWLTNTVADNSTRGATGIALVVCVGNIGAFFTPQIFGWVHSATGDYIYGFIAMAVLHLLGIGCGIWLRAILQRNPMKPPAPHADGEELLDRPAPEREEKPEQHSNEALGVGEGNDEDGPMDEVPMD